MIILESKSYPGNWIRLYPNSGIGKKKWEYVEDKDEATRFTTSEEIEKKLNSHKCPVRYTAHHTGSTN